MVPDSRTPVNDRPVTTPPPMDPERARKLARILVEGAHK